MPVPTAVRDRVARIGIASHCHGATSWDVENPQAFVADAVRDSKLSLRPEQRHELEAEGIVIFHELAARYQPRLNGYEQDGRFSGYCAKYLRLRLGDSWKRMNGGRQVRDPDTGEKAVVYDAPHLSLSFSTPPSVRATSYLPHVPIGAVARALQDMPPEHRLVARRIVALMRDDKGTDGIARELGMRRSEVQDTQRMFGERLRVAMREDNAA